MAKKGSFWDNPFGGLFDFNGDGKEDFGEQWLAMKIFEECTKEEKPEPDYSGFDLSGYSSSRYIWRQYCQDGSEYGVDPFDYDTEEDYNDAIQAAKYAWRDTCEDGFEFGIAPENYETEEEYAEALEAAKEEWRVTCEDGSDVGIDPDDYETELEALNAINRADYPNQRTYDAACHLCDVKQGTGYIPDSSSPEQEIARCEFILHSDAIAAKYLTVFQGFLFAQAVKEHFQLPIDVPDEEDEVVTYFDDLFLELAEEDTALAVKVWSWCIQEFGPYHQYTAIGWILYNGILHAWDDYPPEFMDLVVKQMADDPAFCKGLIEENPEFPAISKYIAYALEHNQASTAVQMFRSAIAHPLGKGKKLEELIDSVISECSNWDELETMEAFGQHILPIIAEIDDKRIQRLLPKFKEKVEQYIESVETSEEKYQYSRRFAWRRTCQDGSPYDIDPLDYDTEEEYNAAILEEKYRWRNWYARDAARYHLDLTAYETEEEFEKALASRRSTPNADPLADTDKTVYTFCGVLFAGSDRRYYYRTDDDTLTIGDMVVVPVGYDGKDAVAEVVTVEKHRRKTAPYPVDRAKFIKGRYVEG